MIIRKANIMDLPWIVQEGTKFLKFYFPNKDIDTGFITMQLDTLMRNGTILVSQEQNSELTGMIAGVVTPDMWYPEEKTLAELFWWVTPEKRCGRSSLMLMREFIETGKQLGVNYITLSLLTVSPVNQNALIKRGFELKEKAFVMEV